MRFEKELLSGRLKSRLCKLLTMLSLWVVADKPK
jgi:hypothetical protein